LAGQEATGSAEPDGRQYVASRSTLFLVNACLSETADLCMLAAMLPSRLIGAMCGHSIASIVIRI
jgi:hypothetical protein